MGKQNSVILVAEDDNQSRAALRGHLQAAGYQVVEAVDGEEALLQFEHFDIDFVVLDILMPKLNGLEVCRAIRQQSDVPIIMVTVLGSADDRVAGLEMGANDYMVKPFSGRELVARIRAILRRTPRRGAEESTESAASVDSIEIGLLTIDPITRRVYKSGRFIRLTEIEFHILLLLASEPGRIFSRADILNQIWGYSSAEEMHTKTVDVHVSRLRVKLGKGRSNRSFIMTIHGRGYTFEASE